MYVIKMPGFKQSGLSQYIRTAVTSVPTNENPALRVDHHVHYFHNKKGISLSKILNFGN